MNIEDFYLGVSDLIAEVPEIKWIDMDFGQLDSTDSRPAVAFPCALISIDFPDIADLGNKKQKPQVLINVRLGFNYAGETSHSTPEQAKSRALAYYAIVKAVYAKLQGQRLGGSQLRRIRQVEAATPQRVKVVDMPFRTEFIDESAAV